MNAATERRLPGAWKRTVRDLCRQVRDWPRYHRSRPVDRLVGHVVFVCKGNICRSAFAEHYLRARLAGSALKLESCGLEGEAGNPSPAAAVAAAARQGVDLRGHRARGLEDCDLGGADLILAMEFWQYRRLCLLYPGRQGRIRLLREFAPGPEGLLCNIADPYGQGDAAYDACFRLIGRAVDGLKRFGGSP